MTHKVIFKNKGWILYHDGSYTYTDLWNDKSLSIEEMHKLFCQMVEIFPEHFEDKLNSIRLCEKCLLPIDEREVYTDFYHCGLCRKDYKC